jgi:hypothetical protein
MRNLLAIGLLAIASCAPCSFPKDAVAPPNVLGIQDDCGYWAIAVDDHLVLGLAVESDATTCHVEVDDGVRLNSEPIFTNFGEDGPRFTFDLVGNAPTERGSVEIECDDGTRWQALVEVAP